MMELDKQDVLNLYLLLSDGDDLPERFNRLLVKLEKEIFVNYTVMEIEKYRLIFNDKGKI